MSVGSYSDFLIFEDKRETDQGLYGVVFSSGARPKVRGLCCAIQPRWTFYAETEAPMALELRKRHETSGGRGRRRGERRRTPRPVRVDRERFFSPCQQCIVLYASSRRFGHEAKPKETSAGLRLAYEQPSQIVVPRLDMRWRHGRNKQVCGPNTLCSDKRTSQAKKSSPEMKRRGDKDGVKVTLFERTINTMDAKRRSTAATHMWQKIRRGGRLRVASGMVYGAACPHQAPVGVGMPDVLGSA